LTLRAFLVALLLGISMAPVSAAAADHGRVLTFHDRRITESSGLVDLGNVMVTTNDSGSRSKLYVVDQSTGHTVGVTDFHAKTVDVEALAPAGGRAVWVGDIGDNRTARKSVSVYRVNVRAGARNVHPVKYRLTYPKGARNAESLFADRRGRLHVITKSIMGGTVYQAPRVLRPNKPNRLERIGRVIDFATDAAMLRDKRHIIVRGPGQASVYTFPGLKRLGSFGLPRQRQGEGVSVGPGSRIRLSSEGARSTVLQVSLPAAVRQRMRPAAAAPPPSPSPSAPPSPSPSASASASPGVEKRKASGPDLKDGPWLMWSIPGVIVLGAVGIGIGLWRRSE
jgi:hypothetical protein